MSIDTIALPELVAIGVAVEATWDELPRAVPAAWRSLFERDTGATAFLEVSISRENGVYRELVGFLAASSTEVPDGMTRLVIPAQRYLRIMHDGPLQDIAAGFGKLYAHAAVHELGATDFKLDFGYLPGLPPGRHELHVALAPAPLRLA
jgi:predicted transcriptional regulator YdeE